jgi:hypothetical protein
VTAWRGEDTQIDMHAMRVHTYSIELEEFQKHKLFKTGNSSNSLVAIVQPKNIIIWENYNCTTYYIQYLNGIL